MPVLLLQCSYPACFTYSQNFIPKFLSTASTIKTKSISFVARKSNPSSVISMSHAVPPIIVYCSSFPLNHSLKLLIPVTIYIFPHNFSNISSTTASTRSSASSLNDNARESSSTLSSFDNKCGLYLHISTAI